MSATPAVPLGPGSLLWNHASDLRSLLPGTAAGLMQLMYPELGAGVAGHSDFFNEPYERIYRSVPQIWATILRPDGAERAGRIRDLHKGIGGVDERGRRYHALEPETFWWAHATFTWEIFRAAELFHPGDLGPVELERLYAETVTWYSRYGVSMRPVPPDYPAFESKFWRICTERLELTPAAARALRIGPPGGPGRSPDLVSPDPLERARRAVLKRPMRLMTLGCMPAIVRTRLDLRWNAKDQAQFDALALAFRQGFHLVPGRINHLTLRTLLRRMGAQTRADRYAPAA